MSLLPSHRLWCIALVVVACSSRIQAASPATAPTTRPMLTFTSEAFGHNFARESGEIVLRLADGVRATGGQVRVTDESGRLVQEQRIPPGDAPLSIPLKGKGYFDIAASVTDEQGRNLTAKTSASVVGPLLPNELRESSPFGFFSVRSDTPLPVIAGAGWNRLFIPLNGVERSPSGDLKWWRPNAPAPKAPDTFEGKPAPLKWVGVFMFPPLSLVAPEQRTKHNNFNVYPPADWDGLRQVVQFAAKHYGQWVEYFEPINEPDANWRGSEQQLVRYHQVVAEAVHAADPKLKVVGPCLCELDLARLRKLASLGLFDHLDGLSIHAYANDAPPEGKWWANVRGLRPLLKSLGKESMPIVISEYGWQTARGDWARPVDMLSQARYAVRSLTLLAAEQVSAINYFCLRYDDARIPHVQGWSVVEQDNTPRPAFASIANVSHWLAGVEGRGTVLHPAPDVWLVLFRKGTSSVAVAWTVRGESSFRIPARWTRVEDMMGRTVTPAADGSVALSESPTFIQMDDGQLPTVQISGDVRVVRGSEVDLPGDWTGASLPGPLALHGGRLSASRTASAGDYLVLNRRADGTWTAVTVTVLPRFAVEATELVWPADKPSPAVRMTIRSYGEAIDVLPMIRLEGAAPRFAGRIALAANEQKVAEVELRDLPLGRRWTGVAAVEATVEDRVETATAPLDIAIVTGGPRAADDTIDWAGVPKHLSRGWLEFGGAADASIRPEDCSATLQWTWNQQGIHLRVEVQDDDHVQDREPAQMWQQDSLQIAFDVDADKAWQYNVNNDVVGLNGHRVFEYGVSLRDGHPQTARWRENLVKLPADVPPIDARISRRGTMTTYELTFPWRSLGLQEAPSAGSSIGFDLVVNDVDSPNRRRHGIEMFGGINSSKEPERFGRLLLRGAR